MGKIRIGISGWSYDEWKGDFYPEDLGADEQLEYAAGEFDTIEINGTFYGLTDPVTCRRGVHLGRWRGPSTCCNGATPGCSPGETGFSASSPASLPRSASDVRFSIYYHRRWIEIHLFDEGIELTSEVTRQPPIEVECRGARVRLESGETVKFHRDGESAWLE